VPPAGWKAALKPQGAVFVAALLLRLLLLSARGDFLEFDETFYLLIARSLVSGEGFRMNGLPQVAFPPLPALLDALLGLVFSNLVAASRVAAAALGAALVFPAAALARMAFGATEGRLAALLVAVMPSLMTFVPVHRSYAGSLYFGPEPLYVFLFTCAGLLLARAAASIRAADALAAGLVAGLTYLARNEAISFIPAAVALLLGAGAHRLRKTAAFLGAAAIAAAPYPLYLHGVTGEWSFSGKTGSAVLIRESIARKVSQDDPARFEALHYALDESGRSMKSSYWGFDPSAAAPSPGPGSLLDTSFEGMRQNLLIYFRRMLPTLLPWFLWPFVLAGCAAAVASVSRRPRTAGRDQCRAMLAMACMTVPSLAVCLLLFVEPRHHLYLVPLLCILCARGITIVLVHTPARAMAAARALVVLLTAGLLWTALHQLADLRDDGAELRYLESVRRMGEELRRMVPADDPIMSWHPAIAWYAERPWRVMPADKMARVAAYAIRRGAAVIVYETSVHGPPPGGEGRTPFTLVRLAPADPDQVQAGLFSLRRLDGGDLYETYELGPAGR